MADDLVVLEPLKPAPCYFCGSEDTGYTDDEDGKWFGYCADCGAQGPINPNSRTAIELWNAPRAYLAVVLEKMRRYLAVIDLPAYSSPWEEGFHDAVRTIETRLAQFEKENIAEAIAAPKAALVASEAAREKLRHALDLATQWISNWHPAFCDDDEWLSAKRVIDDALAAPAKEPTSPTPL